MDGAGGDVCLVHRDVVPADVEGLDPAPHHPVAGGGRRRPGHEPLGQGKTQLMICNKILESKDIYSRFYGAIIGLACSMCADKNFSFDDN